MPETTTRPYCLDCQAPITPEFEAQMKRIYGNSLKIDLCDDCDLQRSLQVWDLQHGK